MHLKAFLVRKIPGPGGFISEFYQTFKGEQVSILHTLFHKIEEEGILSNIFFKTNITVI